MESCARHILADQFCQWCAEYRAVSRHSGRKDWAAGRGYCRMLFPCNRSIFWIQNVAATIDAKVATLAAACAPNTGVEYDRRPDATYA